MLQHPRAVQHGFSLLEVLVAFVILSLVVTALFRVFGASLANVSAAEDYSRAVIVAESVLAESGGAQPLRAGSSAGSADDGRIAGKSTVAPYDPPGVDADVAAASASMPLRLYRVAVEVNFPSPNGGQRSIALATTRLGASERALP
jgi:general secretion pathway protein I